MERESRGNGAIKEGVAGAMTKSIRHKGVEREQRYDRREARVCVTGSG